MNAKQSRFQGMFKEVNALYGPPRLRRMALICHFTWCVTALSYYVTGKYDAINWLFYFYSQFCIEYNNNSENFIICHSIEC